LPRRIPGVRLGRLAVDRQYQGKGLGELLLIDALTRARRIYTEAGGIGLFVDALDAQAAGYYPPFRFRGCAG
jgi:GNAT superfamily N-acetyltransferase